jgi:hypothetical protein
MDPREALLRQENNKKKDKMLDHFENVFKRNMPTPIFAKETLEAEMEKDNKKRKQ